MFYPFVYIININTGEITEGDLSGKQTKLVLAWAELHKEELLADWELKRVNEAKEAIEKPFVEECARRFSNPKFFLIIW